MGKALIEIITETIHITGNATTDGILFFIIAWLSFSVAWGFVGRLFDFLGFYDSDLMSNVHWFVRVVVFIGLTWFSIKAVQFFTWLLSFQWWVYLIAIFSLILVISVIYIIKYNLAKKHSKLIEQTPVNKELNMKTVESYQTNQHEISTPIIDMRYFCPRCGASLVKRHGPYGYFWGCNSFPKTGCRYTRKYL